MAAVSWVLDATPNLQRGHGQKGLLGGRRRQGRSAQHTNQYTSMNCTHDGPDHTAHREKMTRPAAHPRVLGSGVVGHLDEMDADVAGTCHTPQSMGA